MAEQPGSRSLEAWRFLGGNGHDVHGSEQDDDVFRRDEKTGKSIRHLGPAMVLLAGTLIGILLGHFAPAAAVAMKPFGDAFIKMIRMMIGPIIFVTVVHGIAGMNDMKSVGRVALKSIIYFEVITILALIFGLVAVDLWRPGEGMNIDAAAIDTASIKT
nr:cation:dicarboxylase symporter family transporter [Rhizobium leguminosarum]